MYRFEGDYPRRVNMNRPWWITALFMLAPTSMLVVTIIGALNWGLIGFFNWNLVDAIFGGGAQEITSGLSRFIYALVGLAGLALAFLIPWGLLYAAFPGQRGFQLGDGLFETLRVRRGVAIELALHLARLREGLGVLARGGMGRVVLHAFLEGLDALGEVAHQAGNLALAEEHENKQHDNDNLPRTDGHDFHSSECAFLPSREPGSLQKTGRPRNGLAPKGVLSSG